MSATPTPSESSGHTLYYDALEMQSPRTDNSTVRSTAARPDSTRSTESARLTGAVEQPSHPEEPAAPAEREGDEVEEERAASLRSLPVEPEGNEQYMSALQATLGRTGSAVGRRGSVRSMRTNGTASAFANGAPLTGPDAEAPVDESMITRGAKAERTLSQKQKNRIVDEERKESKKFSRLLKTESTTEKVALDSALKTLATLQGLHKAAIKRAARAEDSHAKALSAAQKAEGKYQEERAKVAEWRARAEAHCMEERARWEGKQGEVQAQQERLDSARETVRETETRIADCAREVERLRIFKATDEREREAKLTMMTADK